MNKKFIVIIASAVICLLMKKDSQASQDFYHRYGASSHITNSPFYFKQKEMVKAPKAKQKETKAQKQAKKKTVAKKRVAQPVTQTVNTQPVKIKHTTLKGRQAELEQQKTKLQREMADLENKRIQQGNTKL